MDGKQVTSAELVFQALDLISRAFYSKNERREIDALERGVIEQVACQAYALKVEKGLL